MLYFVGLGLGDARDITVKGLEVVRSCEAVYLEHYTSILTVGKEQLEKFYGREVILADRELVEQGVGEVLDLAKEKEVAFLVVGDPFGATTHADLVLRCREQNIPHRVIHNASIMNAVGCCGLQLYNFGETVSIPFWTDSWRPTSFLKKITGNLERGLHTLCLLDIKVKEQSDLNLARGRKVYEPPRFMSCAVAAQQLLGCLEAWEEPQTEEGSADTGTPASCPLSREAPVVCLARVGAEDQQIVTSSLSAAASLDLGAPLHSLVIPGHCHPLELEALDMWRAKES